MGDFPFLASVPPSLPAGAQAQVHTAVLARLTLAPLPPPRWALRDLRAALQSCRCKCVYRSKEKKT